MIPFWIFTIPMFFAILLLFDIMMTTIIGADGVRGTCQKCNWQCSGSFMTCFIRQTIHRCDDNLI